MTSPKFFYAAVAVSSLLAIGSGLLLFVPVSGHSVIATKVLSTLPRAADKPTPQATLVFFGDIMLGRNVEAHSDKAGNDNYPFQKITDFIQSADFAFANLEGPIVHEHSETPTGSFVFSFKDDSAEVLKTAGIDGVSLANNHALNQGQKGFEETQSLLDTAGIVHAGHPYDMSAQYVAHTAVNGIPFIIAGFNMTFPEDDPDAAVATVAQLRRSSSEPIIVMMHWGTEYALHSNAHQETLAHELIDAGASLIIGAHPHVVEEVEEYHGKWIFYSLGNFIFDQYFSTDTEQGLAVMIKMTDNGPVDFTLEPLASHASQPELMTDPDRANFLDALKQRSDELCPTKLCGS